MDAAKPVLIPLRKAFRAGAASRIAFTGAGGKTTAMFRLAHELAASFGTVFVTTTTHLAAHQAGSADALIRTSNLADLTRLESEAPAGVVLLCSDQIHDGRLSGPAPAVLGRLAEIASRIGAPLLIEADGARMLPLKAPGPHEPAVPEFADTFVVLAGLSGLGKPLTPEWVHRPERFSELSGLSPGAEITVDALARVLRHPEGGLKGAPLRARRLVLFNQADTPLLQSAGNRLSVELAGEFDGRIVAALGMDGAVFSVRERIAAVVLAAGAATRMGAPKQMLVWKGKPLVVHAAEKALAAGCSPVVIVGGAAGDQVGKAVAHLPVRFVQNSLWEKGQSSSVKAGLAVLPEAVGGAMFVLVDQPFVDAPLLQALIDQHARTLHPVIAPLIDQQRGNPVLFDRETFPDFSALEGDAGGRQLFSRHPVSWLPWHDSRALLDIDTASDVESILRGS